MRVLLLDVLGAGADDHAQFHLPVRLLGLGRDGHVVIGPGKAAHLLGEDHRLRRHLQARFRGVVGIVEADGDELLRIGDAGADARVAAHQRQRFRLDLAAAAPGPWGRYVSPRDVGAPRARGRGSCRPCREGPAFPCPSARNAEASCASPLVLPTRASAVNIRRAKWPRSSGGVKSLPRMEALRGRKSR